MQVRPSSAKTSTISVSTSQVREISDPSIRLVHQLHKLIFISQLPPSLAHNPCRTLVERFKRALFAKGISPVTLKAELQRLAALSRENVDLNLGHIDGQLLLKQLQREHASNPAFKSENLSKCLSSCLYVKLLQRSFPF